MVMGAGRRDMGEASRVNKAPLFVEDVTTFIGTLRGENVVAAA